MRELLFLTQYCHGSVFGYQSNLPEGPYTAYFRWLLSNRKMIDSRRKHVLPELIRFVCDPNLDAMTRSWIFDALRDVTGEPLGDDPAAWRSWYLSVTGKRIGASTEADQVLIAAAWLQP